MDSLASTKVRIIHGRALHVDQETVWLARGRKLLRSNDAGRSWEQRAILPANSWYEYLASHRLGRRLGRVGFHHLTTIGSESSIIIANRYIFHLEQGNNKLQRIAPLIGSRPLSLCVGNGIVCYGEYCANEARSPIHVWAADINDMNTWKPVWQFKNIRHVHGVFFDHYTSSFWLTTGDRDSESGIWMTTDDFQTLEQVAGGSQQYRAVQLLFSEKHIYFGTDAPHQKNHIYRLDRKTGSIELLADVGGPVFYGVKVGDKLFFSTVVEPSKVNTSRYAEVWGTPDGASWKLVRQFRKDNLPMKYFQYGQIMFPAGAGDDKHLWCTPFATEQDQQTVAIPLEELW